MSKIKRDNRKHVPELLVGYTNTALVSAGALVGAGTALNITNGALGLVSWDFNGSEPIFSEFRQTERNYQYYVKANKIIFNTVIKGILINVSFYKQNDSFRLVSKLYRTNRKIDDITPEVYGYAIYLNKRE